jgi:hypothetical protein
VEGSQGEGTLTDPTRELAMEPSSSSSSVGLEPVDSTASMDAENTTAIADSESGLCAQKHPRSTSDADEITTDDRSGSSQSESAPSSAANPIEAVGIGTANDGVDQSNPPTKRPRVITPAS